MEQTWAIFLVMKTTHTHHRWPSLKECTRALSNLAKCLEELSLSYQSDPPLIEAEILDGAANVNMLKPGHCKTFQQYGEEVFLSYVQQ